MSISRSIEETQLLSYFKKVYSDYYLKIGIPVLRALSHKNGMGINVALLDSGVDILHPYLAGKVTEVKSFIDNNPRDLYGHGTAIAGIMFSKTIGLCKGARLFNYKVTNGSHVDIHHISDAFNYMINESLDDIDVIVMSFGSEKDNPHLYAMTKYLADKGKVVVASKSNTSDVSYPSDYPHVLSIGGKGCDINIKNMGIPTLVHGKRFAIVDGNSYANAIGASIVVLLLSLYRKYNLSYDLNTILEDARTDSKGRLNAINKFIDYLPKQVPMKPEGGRR